MQPDVSRSLGGWTCPIHGGYSNLTCCAWPECAHGVSTNTLEVHDPVLGKTETYRRVSWRGIEEEEFHDWQYGDRSYSRFLGRVYSYFQAKYTAPPALDQMFHYTSVEGALAIINSGRLRFTDYAYLNDTREVTYGFDVIREVLDEILTQSDSNTLSGLKTSIEVVNPLSPFNIYTGSFSTHSDSLSQFRLYGPVALGFEANQISFFYPKGDSSLGHVVYDRATQIRLVRLFFDLIRQCDEKDDEVMKRAANPFAKKDYLISHLLQIAAFFKHPAFADEREVRMMYSETTATMDQFGAETARRQFRAAGGLIVPFTDTFEMQWRRGSVAEETKKLPLTSVMIGPVAQADVLARGLREVLASEGFDQVEVLLSEAPFRR